MHTRKRPRDRDHAILTPVTDAAEDPEMTRTSRTRRWLCATLSALALTALTTVSADTIRIGVLLPYTGTFAPLAKDQDLALEMGFDDFGRTVAGHTITLVKADTETNPAAGLRAMKTLVEDDNVDIVMGIVGSNVAEAVRDHVHDNAIPLVIMNAGSDRITGALCSPWIVRTSFSNTQITTPIGPWLANTGHKTAFLIAFDYAAGHQMMDNFKTGFTGAGGTIIGESYPPLAGTKDFGPYIAEAKAADPDVVYVFFAGGPAIKFAREWAAYGMKSRAWLAGPGWLNSALYVKAQGSAAIGTLGVLNYYPSIDTPENKDFQARFRERHQRDASEFGVAAYDAVRLVVTALETLGGATDDKAALVEAMRKIEFNGPRGPFRIDPRTNNVVQNIYIADIVAQGPTVAARVLETFEDVHAQPDGCNLARAGA